MAGDMSHLETGQAKRQSKSRLNLPRLLESVRIIATEEERDFKRKVSFCNSDL